MTFPSRVGAAQSIPVRSVRALRDAIAGRAPVSAVILGTFTLRLATGVTGTMLLYYFAQFEHHGGPRVEPWHVGLMGALFYASELIGSPIFGVLSDRVGHRRVMLIGPAFGAIAVAITALTISLPVIAFTRILEGGSTAASVPSILGFIAFATAADELARGRAVARFEAATLAGILGGLVLAGLLFPVFGPAAFFVNALLYLLSFSIFRVGVRPDAEPLPAAAAHAPGEGLGRYLRILRSRQVWLLAPTWIAINATLGLFTSQTLFQLVKAKDPAFADQQLMGGFSPMVVSLVIGVGGVLFFAGLLYWGDRFKSLRRTTIILRGIMGGFALLAAITIINHAADAPPLFTIALLGLAGGGLFVLAGATPAALGLLADVTEAFPDDRGAIMGLYSVFLGLGQITGAIVGGLAAQRAGLDGIFVAALVLLGVALVPLTHLRGYEHEVGRAPVPAPHDPAPSPRA
jgi:MFS family permease